jgi:general secretion pathway protein K
MSARARSSRRRRAGFVVVAVLWLMAMLAALAATFALYIVNTNAAVARHGEKLQTEALVQAGVELVAYQLTARREFGLFPGRFVFQSGATAVNVAFRGEAARIDLNRAPPELIAGLFVALGAAPPAAQGYAERIVAWRGLPQAGAQDAEASAYRAAGLNYVPRNGPFPHVGELALVRGLPEALVERALPFVTVYSGQPEVNATLAPPEVLAALPGMTSDRLYAALALRERDPQNMQALVAQLGPSARYVTVEGGRATRVAVDVALANGRRTRTEVVILLFEDDDTEPYRVLSWSDEVYETTEIRPSVERR